MNGFKPTKILSAAEVVAEQLRQGREEKNLELKDIAKKLNIKYGYLEALEKGEYNKLPAGIYGKNFLKEYAIFLGLDYKRLIKDLAAEKSLGREEKNKEIFSQQIVKKYNFLVIPKIIRSFVIVIIVLALFTYLGFCLKRIISPPLVDIIEPPDNLVTDNNFVIVLGKTEPEAQVTINGELIPLSQDATQGVVSPWLKKESFFTKRVNLKVGLNTITIIAKKKYGREITIQRQILVNE